jgi:hypothetical protein
MTNAQTGLAADKGVESPHKLIASDRVEGTKVFRPTGERVGHIERIMIDKVTGQSMYAVMNFGGFLGINQESYPLPWSVLTNNPKLGGYEVEISDAELKSASKMAQDNHWDFGDRRPEQIPLGYYGVPRHWI